MKTRSILALATAACMAWAGIVEPARACTGISLRSQDGAVVVSRTVEWALSDAQHNRLAIFPRGKSYVASTPAGSNGKRWKGRYGFVSMTAYGQPYGPDGMNERGLYVGMYYLPGYASYSVYVPALADRSMSVGDFMQWMLSSFETVEEVRKHLATVTVVNVDDPRFGGAQLPFHWKVADPGGASIVIEIVDGGQVRVYDAFLGVITNSPTYDWHLTNLRNFIRLTPKANEPLTIGNLQLGPLGAGSGMIGLPGDFTPPSRFIRAAALTASVRPLATATDAVFESFRILDSFNIPLGAVAPRDQVAKDIESATQITSASDLTNRRYYFHTMRNRQVRMIDLNRIDFARVKEQVLDDDQGRTHAVREVMIEGPGQKR
ncbi:MAG: choloylglycine hydrolase family protein [Burkholderiales bacterium]|jgi:choloylglycine hydrolase|nr:choloylglycine hydrolase family protein [Burkholderiales bacterium]